ncbi:hypothetical protein D3C80_1101810 [compost metagenome]
MEQRALGKLAFRRFDCTGELPTLRDAHDLVFLNASIRKRVEYCPDASRVEANFVE